MFRKTLTTILLICLVAVMTAQPTDGQTISGANPDVVRVNGLVIDRKKYSFTLQTLDRNYTVKIPNGTPVLMKLNKPNFDLMNRTISVVLMQSAADGNAANDEVLSWPLADPTYISSTFDDPGEMKRVLDQQTRKLERYIVSSTPFERTPLTFGGELAESRTDNLFFLNDHGGIHSVKLGTRRGLLSGFTIMDLQPLQSSVWVQGAWDGDTVVASRIRLEYLGDPTAGFDESLPSLLSLGDVTSYDYQRPLIEALAGKVNFHHPPAWTGPSKNWDRLHHYIGVLDSATPVWDVISFNYGIHDDTQSRQQYQQNLRNVVRLLKRTGARLVWVNSTPVPNGFSGGDPNQPLEGRVRGRMKLQNQWAVDVMKDFPEIAVCDLWQVVKDGEQDVFSQWWTKNQINFEYSQSIPLGRTLAKSVLHAMGSAQEPNPISVHGQAESVSSSR